MRETDSDPHIILERKFFETKGSGQILDCGCGTGEILKRFSSNNQISIIGLDISKQCLDSAKKFGVVVRGSGEKLPFKQESFDAIIAYQVLHHMSDPMRALKEINSALKRGGVLLLSETLENNPFIRVGRLFYPYFKGMSVLSKFDLKKLERLIKNTGFKIVYSFTDYFLAGLVHLLGRIILLFRNLKQLRRSIYKSRLAKNIDKNRALSRFHGHYFGLFVKI